MWVYTCHNDIHDYKLKKKIINATSNGLTLRADLHQLFDQHCFIFAVKDGDVLVHFLFPVNNAAYVKDAPLAVPENVPAELMYSRFALSILEQLDSSALDGLRLVPPIRVEDGNMASATKKRGKSISQPPSADTAQIPESIGAW
ncbi:uncharacterized protein PHACADRAFT_248058 [Phanerochaete carnosa HHB-10118-sp]|uniref:HNH nuclease domain-containing protein n=1 Tax=Phanerochaete carnosa (strain HHB-10118-sp) TaxID=650164 RepID=K5VEK7_PHACS|nr:uncharacterized protein PHACADRAFT_248058 [Phanerochaete carnosa HHB-10118-sp]EKM61446.1 hypothetical protein PHACADRAFT_248058 [Phanerochaete carnosa HHB-10118-sp]